MEEQEEKKKFPPTLAILLIVLLVVLVLFLYVNRQKLNNQASLETAQKVENPSPTQIPTSLILTAEKPSFIAGQSVVLTVKADSHAEDVVGFDLLVTYDQGALSFVKAQAVDAAFSLYPRTASTHLSITGIKKPTVKDVKSFANAPLMTLTFQAKKAGSYKFTIVPKIGRETTKLVNDKTQVFNPNSESLTIEVK